jgi:hypothetical protein
MSSHWSTIDTLVRDIGALAADVHMAERTLPTDPRTAVARHALDAATVAICTAIDEASLSAAANAAAAIAEAREAVATLGLTNQTSRELAAAARRLTRQLEEDVLRSAELRRRFVERQRRKV